MPSTEHFSGSRAETVVLCGRDRPPPESFHRSEPRCAARGRTEQAPRMTSANPDARMVGFVAEHHWGVLVTIKRDGRPQLSNVGYFMDAESGLIRVSVTADRAKTRNLEADPRVGLHVTSKDFWTWVVVEGTAELTPVAAEPDDATVADLVPYSRGIKGEHPDGDDSRAAMARARGGGAGFSIGPASGQRGG